MSVKFIKTGVDGEVIGLLKKLPDAPVDILARDIEKEFISAIKVVYNEKLYGLLLVRGEITINRELVLVLLHGIACDNIGLTFTEIVGQSIFQYAAKCGFQYVRQHVVTQAQAKLWSPFYDGVSEIIYLKKVDASCQPETKMNQVPAHLRQPPITTTVSPTTRVL